MLSDDVLNDHIARLNAPAPPLRLERPCTVGDGVLPAAPATRPASASPLRFVPASGAATRLFEALRRVVAPDLATLRRQVTGDPSLEPALRALTGWSRLALSRALPDADPTRDLPATVDALVQADLSARPKGLVPFHLDGVSGWRSALEGHLREAAHSPDARAHFTAPADHLDAFHAEVEAAVARVADDTGVRVRVGLSVQHPDTDTPALDPDGRLITRPEDGTPWLRPGGHGALLRNLGELSGFVRILNVDNIAHVDHRDALRPWGDRLVNEAVTLREARDHHLERVRRGEGLAEARGFLTAFGRVGPVQQDAILGDLDRPVRVCAVVPNEGQPGGGPFWVRGPDGRVTPQIVEGAEVDHDDPEQAAIWSASTHFNPVDMVCCLDDPAGRPYDLERFVDDTRWIRTRKRHGGQPARCLERPGLWNGAMSGWLTRFVAVPRETFNPVKTVADLLAERHLPTR